MTYLPLFCLFFLVYRSLCQSAVYMSVCLSILSVYLSITPTVNLCLSFCVYHFINTSICVSIDLSSICLLNFWGNVSLVFPSYISLSFLICLYICLSVCMFVGMSIHIPAYLSIGPCILIWLFVCPSFCHHFI